MTKISKWSCAQRDSLLLSQIWGRNERKGKSVGRAAIEIAFIIFLFYSNLLMGEFERSGVGQTRGFLWATADVFTSTNFGIAVAAAIVGYIVLEYLRKRF